MNRAPSTYSPWMYAPSRVAASISSGPRLVTSTVKPILSSGHSFLRAVTWSTAVRKACGLKRPEIHVTLGVAISAVQLPSCVYRSSTLESHDASGRRHGHARASHASGTRSS